MRCETFANFQINFIKKIFLIRKKILKQAESTAKRSSHSSPVLQPLLLQLQQYHQAAVQVHHLTLDGEGGEYRITLTWVSSRQLLVLGWSASVTIHDFMKVKAWLHLVLLTGYLCFLPVKLSAKLYFNFRIGHCGSTVQEQLLLQQRGFIQTSLENVFPTQELSLACRKMFCIKRQ